MFYVFVYIDDI